MSGSHDSGMAAESSTAVPNVISPATACGALLKMTVLKTIVSANSAVMAIPLMTPRFLMPITTQTAIRTPMTAHHAQTPGRAMTD